MVPSLSDAEAVNVMFAGAVKIYPLIGSVKLTVGGALTVIATAADVVVAPALSKAFAVRL